MDIDSAIDAMRQAAVRHNAPKPKAPKKQRGKKSKGSQPENAVVKACLQYLRTIGCFVWKNKTGGYKPHSDSDRVIRYGKVGSADILGVTPRGRFISCECKHGKNEQSDYQSEFQRQVEQKGGIYILAYSADDCIARVREIIG